MVRHLHTGTSPPPGSPRSADGLVRHYYTCSLLGPDGNCTAYETRPDMCRAFPYAPCPYPGCTNEPHTRPDVKLSRLLVKRPVHAAQVARTVDEG